jgi:hypothetical protein
MSALKSAIANRIFMIGNRLPKYSLLRLEVLTQFSTPDFTVAYEYVSLGRIPLEIIPP